jgi:deoxyribodipyrimidine photo-lyase
VSIQSGSAPTIVWFRRDLRLADHPALTQAAANGSIVPVYVWDCGSRWTPGGASRWWLHQSLESLHRALGGLVLLRGSPAKVIPELARRSGARAVLWNRSYEPEGRRSEQQLAASLRRQGIAHESFPGSVLWEPGRVKTLAGEPFKVFTPFWRACQKVPVAAALPTPKPALEPLEGLGDSLHDWQLLPKPIDWAKQFAATWSPGEPGAWKQLRRFLKQGLLGYAELRDRPAEDGVSRLSPHLHFGEISPRQIWAEIQALITRDADFGKDADKFLTELTWREFSTQLLFEFPALPERNWRAVFDLYPWRKSPSDLRAWQRGETGYPMVDAGMRELWHTGYMHNRVRMIVASFLIKHLRIHWREGEDWFWDTLLDADLANNAASWQWVAGSGADASPYFRVFNPIQQGRKFDPQGHYVRRWCPELARLPNEDLHAPFAALPMVLATAGVTLGKTYPKPIVEHAAARAAALAGYEAVRKASS